MNYSSILLKKLQGKLSEEQHVLFDEWLASSRSNKKLYYTLLSLKGKGADVEKLLSIDADEAWKKVLKTRKQHRPKHKIRKIPLWTAYAASLVFLLSVGYYLIQNTNPFEGQYSSETVLRAEKATERQQASEQELGKFYSAGTDGDDFSKGFLAGVKTLLKKEENSDLVYKTLYISNGKPLKRHFQTEPV